MAAVSLFSYREGELIAVNNFVISNIKHLKNKEILSEFIKKYYTDIDNMPSKIYTPFEVEDMSIISEWFENTKGKKIEIKVPKKGEKKKVINMATKNSKLYLNKKKFEKDVGSSKVYKHILKLKEILGLDNIPRRVECFDISNLKNSFAVGSMVVFVDGNPLNSNYRHFKINTVSGQDDCRMIEEIVTRRIKYLKGSKINIEDSFYIKPDLMVIDGGKAQFNTACNVLRQKGIFNIDVISIAKKEEIIFCNKYRSGIKLDKNSNFMMIVTKIRDESHRFAVNYHRKLRDRYMTNSILDGINGIGEKKKYYIFKKINSIDELKSSSIEDLLNIRGLSYRDAVKVYNSLHK
jgi:excinuclease ABC subunit C